MKHTLKIAVIVVALLSSIIARAQINAEQVMRVGLNALYFEDYMLSIQYFNRAIEAKPYLAKPYFYRAVAKLNLDDYIGAEADATAAIERNRFLSDAYEVRGVARQNQGNHQGAIADYDTALSQLPDNRGILFNKALAQSEVGENDLALETLNRLVAAHPRFDAAYTGRAKVKLALGDTLQARSDLDRALEINGNSANAYVMRADLSMRADHDYQSALNDMDEAIRLQPRVAGYFINRAWLRYNLNDYFGAMADYDYAITLDGTNTIALFNRGLLRAQVSDNDRAVDDFTRVLDLDPDDVRALYNRSQLLKAKNDLRGALADLDRVIERNEELAPLLFERFELLDKMGRRREAMAAYDRAIALSRRQPTLPSTDAVADNEDKAATDSDAGDQALSRQQLARRFASLLTTAPEMTEDRVYNNSNIRGRVQDHDVLPVVEGDFGVAIYAGVSQLAPSTYYMAEADRINAARRLPYILLVTNDDAMLDDETAINARFKSIEQYNKLFAEGGGVPIDYFGRAMDYMTLRDYDHAIADLDRAIDMADDFTLAYLMRAVARHRHKPMPLDDDKQAQIDTHQPALPVNPDRVRLQMILNDLNRVSELSPLSPFAPFNRGNIYLEAGDLTSALSAYTEAIDLKPDFGEAYYNRGYVYLKLGNREAGTADLSRAGQLGIVPSYNLLKRVNSF